jgi:transcriptional regulator
MYLPAHFAESRAAELQRIVREHPLGALVICTNSGLDANHIPFELDDSQGEAGTLRAHVARANPLSEAMQGTPVLVIFSGAQGYVSPNWYPSKQETHRHVPTWNYEAVHVHGALRVLDDATFARGLLARLTRHHEAAEPRPWKMGDSPADYIDALLKQVVGIEVDITRWEGKRKLSQNRESRDVAGVILALDERGNAPLAAAMKRNAP